MSQPYERTVPGTLPLSTAPLSQTAAQARDVAVLASRHHARLHNKVRLEYYTATDEQGQTTLHAREYATLDRAGRVQLPRAMTRRLGIRNRVELQEEPDHIAVWPDQEHE
jgi:DNA-binding transcriptional regulator/RsmH inhibitor MraZ